MRFAGRGLPLALLALGLAYGAAAGAYRIAFVADPLGPRAAPWLLAGLLVLLAIAWLARPGAPPAWPGRAGLTRVGCAIAGLAGYAALLDVLGFVVSTALFAGAMARLAGGPFLAGTGAGLGFAAALYYLFVFALDLSLPIGRVFPFLGG